MITRPSGSAEPPGTDSLSGHDDPASPPEDAAKAAAAFARAWVRRDLPADQWLAGIAPLCTSVFAQRLATVDPGNLPSKEVTGEPKAVRGPAEREAEYTVATNNGTLTVVLVDLQGRWQVANNDFVGSSR